MTHAVKHLIPCLIELQAVFNTSVTQHGTGGRGGRGREGALHSPKLPKKQAVLHPLVQNRSELHGSIEKVKFATMQLAAANLTFSIEVVVSFARWRAHALCYR